MKATKRKRERDDGQQGDKSSKARRGVWKVIRVNTRKAYYGLGPMRQIVNAKRRMARHLRRFPEDGGARQLYATRYGIGALTSPTLNAIGRALRRAKRKTSKAIGNEKKPHPEVL